MKKIIVFSIVILIFLLDVQSQENKEREKRRLEKSRENPQVERGLPLSLVGKEYVYGKIVLGRPTDTSITLSVLTDQDLEGYFEYGMKSDRYTGKTGSMRFSAGRPREVVLSGLNPSTKYFYRMFYRKPETTDRKPETADRKPEMADRKPEMADRKPEMADRKPEMADLRKSSEYSFQTQRKPGEPFTFVVQADPHGRDPNVNFELYERTLQNELADSPDFLVDLGDTFMSDKFASDSATVVKLYVEQRPYFGLVCHSVPLYLVSGNHEGEAGWSLDGTEGNLAIWASKARKVYYPNPVPDKFYSGGPTGAESDGERRLAESDGLRGNYYAWKWGDALFVVLDPYWYTTRKPKRIDGDNWHWTLGKNQYQWFKNTLQASREKFKFVFSHQLLGGTDSSGRGGIECAPYYESGGKNKDGTWGFDEKRPGWGKPLHQLMVENKVTIFFHGHDHLFIRQELDGIVYQEVPQPDHPGGKRTDTAREYGYLHGTIAGNSGHLRVTISENKATVAYVKSYLPKDERRNTRNREIAQSYTITIKE